MQKYLFVLGRNPELSLMETASFLQSHGFQHKMLSFNEHAALVEVEEKNIQEIQNSLGGIVKIGKVFIECEFKKEFLEKELDKNDLVQQKKFFYSINNFSSSHNIANFLKDYLKKRFKQEKARAVLKHGKHQVFSNPSQVIRLKLAETETDFLIYSKEKSLFIAKTVACFNPKELEQRDIKRPEQNPLQAISLRLAKILINLSQAKKEKTILDPFCGIGTVLMEAMNLQINAIGLDNDESMIEGAKRNLNWFKKKYNNSSNYKLFNAKAESISKFVQKNEIDAVASEPYLGPLISFLPPEKKAKETIAELEKLYSAMFAELSKIMKKESIVAIILPQIIADSNKKFRANEKVFLNYGFKKFYIMCELKEHNPYLYRDEESKIERLIYILQKR